jgi:putative ABC transport system substrate-binding protein
VSHGSREQGDRWRRRRFLASAASGAFAAALPGGLAAAAGMKRVALLQQLDVEEGDLPKEALGYIDTHYVKPFAVLGLRDGVNLKLVPYVIPMRSDWEVSIPRAAREIARGGYDGAIAEGGGLTRALREAAPNLPVAAHLFDPVGEGFAQSLAKPGGYVTGTHRGVREVYVKTIDVLRRLVPGATRIAWISWRPQIEQRWAAFDWAARTAGMEVRQVILKVPDFPGLPGDFEALRRDGYRCGHFDGGLDASNNAVSELALRHRIALSFWGHPGDFDREGLLLQYQALRDGVEARLVAAMARILRGAHPRDIPFEGPTSYRMRLNLKTASRIGVKVPDDVLLMMDEVLR